MEIFSTFKRPAPTLHMDSGEVRTETAGYIPRKERIQALQDAGLKLQAYRNQRFMYPDNVVAEKDSGMPDEIFQEPIDIADKARDFSSRMSEQKSNEETKVQEETTKESTTVPESTNDSAKPSGPTD